MLRSETQELIVCQIETIKFLEAAKPSHILI